MEEENKKAIRTYKCPKCGRQLFTRPVLDDNGVTDNQYFELYDIYGHSFLFSTKDLMEIKK
jgi:hypothetical protein